MNTIVLWIVFVWMTEQPNVRSLLVMMRNTDKEVISSIFCTKIYYMPFPFVIIIICTWE